MGTYKQSNSIETLTPRLNHSNTESLIVVQTTPSSRYQNVSYRQTEETSNQESHQYQFFAVDLIQKFEKSISENFKIMTAEIDCLKTQLARVETKFTESSSINQNVKNGNECEETTLTIGLPIRTKQDLDVFEDRLKDSAFEAKVVGLFSSSNLKQTLCSPFLDFSAFESA